jgi:hypothetical protein
VKKTKHHHPQRPFETFPSSVTGGKIKENLNNNILERTNSIQKIPTELISK